MNSMKATAQAPANIAFIKYWGKKDSKLNVPLNDSLSMNLSGALTTTTVEFSSEFSEDKIILGGNELVGEGAQKVFKLLAMLREKAGVNFKALVTTQNSFPTGTGIASSASGFAALSVAAASALGLELSTKELSKIARNGSGSACRSIPDGFVRWHAGNDDSDSFAETLFSHDHWNLHDLVVVVSSNKKESSSSFGHSIATTSPLFEGRLKYLPDATELAIKALEKRDLVAFGEVVEREALCMHAVMMTSNPSIFYWTPETLTVLSAVKELRSQGTAAYFTIDAGPNVHVLCEDKDATNVSQRLSQLKGVEKVIDNVPSMGARVIPQ